MVVPEDLAIAVERGGGQVVVVVSGEIDFGNVARLRSALLEVGGEDKAEVVLDLADLRFMDSTTVGVIIQGKKRVEEKGGRLLVSRLHPRVRRILEVAGLEDYLGLPGAG